jgi:protein O-mannosyl-transferase
MTMPDRRVVLAATLMLAAVAVYLNALANGFALDDIYIIERNARVHDLTNLRAIWLTPYWPDFGTELGLYRPLAIFLYAIQWAIGGGEPWIFHAVNILLHALCTLLAFLLLERLVTTVPAFVGALLFAVHPLHTEAVANVVGQAELVAAAATLGACVIHAARPAGLAISWPRRFALLTLFLIAVLTKENAVVLPALLVIVDLAQRRVPLTLRGVAAYAHAALFTMLLMAGALGAYLLVRFDVLGGTLTGIDAGPTLPFLREDARVLNALRAFPEFARLLFLPLDLSSDYSPAVVLPVEQVTPMVVVGGLLLAGLVVLALLTPWWPATGFPAAWFIISIITVSNLFFPIGVLIAERTLYLPSFAMSALIASIWTWGEARVRARSSADGGEVAGGVSPRMTTYAPHAALAFVVVAFSILTWTRNPDWHSTPRVQAALLRDHPESYRAQWTLGARLWQAGRIDEARVRLEFAYRLYPRDSQFLTEYGNFLFSTGEPDRAIDLLERAHAMHDFVPRTVVLLAFAYIYRGRFEEGLAMTQHARRIGVSDSQVLPLLAFAQEGLGRPDRAVGIWRILDRYSQLRSWRLSAFLARTLAGAGHSEQAMSALDEARRQAPDDASARAILDAIQDSIGSGCYVSRVSARTHDASARDPDGACDPLEYFFISAPAQSARSLHNAMPNPAPEPYPRP